MSSKERGPGAGPDATFRAKVGIMVDFSKNRLLLALVALALVAAACPGTVFSADREFPAGTGSRGILERIVAENPRAYGAAFQLGLAYLEAGDKVAAARVWEQCVHFAPPGPATSILKERLTIIRLDLAREQARLAVQNGPGPETGREPLFTLAVLDFPVAGGGRGQALGRGLAAMLVTDLSKAPGLTVVERARVAALTREMGLAGAGLVDPSRAREMARLLSAGHLVRGSMALLPGEDLDLDLALTSTAQARDIGGKKFSGPLDQLFSMEKQAVEEILRLLGIALEKLSPKEREAILREHTGSLEAFLLFSQGLGHLDRGEFGQAREAFSGAVEGDPGFDLARQYLESTPRETDAQYVDNPAFWTFEAEAAASGESGDEPLDGEAWADQAEGELFPDRTPQEENAGAIEALVPRTNEVPGFPATP